MSWTISMNGFGAAAGVIFVAAITPGPNNLLVLKLARERDLRSSLAAIAAIVIGGAAMIAVARAGMAAFALRHTWIRDVIVFCGASYLVVLGLLLVYHSVDRVASSSGRVQIAPNGLLALFVFQFVNPKAWVLVLTVSAAAHCLGRCDPQSTTLNLVLLFSAVSSGCLFVWVLLGRLTVRVLHHDRVRARFDCVMGLLLVASAASLLLA
jgi:threonine/homoserine/homoserine lactone efflux protein